MNFDLVRSPDFEHYLGIDYSGAKTSDSSCKGLRIYRSHQDHLPVEVQPPQGRKKYWTRRALAEWLVDWMEHEERTLVGIDHGFSFPLSYFQTHDLSSDWDEFLKDFHRHWPTDEEGVTVDSVRQGQAGQGAARYGDSTWRRLTEKRAGGAKSVFHFDVPGQVAKSTHAGLPWLLHLRRELGKKVQFWPFDGWVVPQRIAANRRHLVVEVYPSLWNREVPRVEGTADQHDAFTIAAWLRQADLLNKLGPCLWPDMEQAKRSVVKMEGWILGVK